MPAKRRTNHDELDDDAAVGMLHDHRLRSYATAAFK
jgi:hypothetical protein